VVKILVLAAVASVTALGGCGSVPPYHCDVDAECAGGMCAPGGACAFADPACSSGYSYDTSAGDLAGACVAIVAGDTPDRPRTLEERQTLDVAQARDDYAPSCAASAHGRDVFFQVTIPERSRLYVDTFGSNFGVVIAVRPGTCATAKSELACGTASCSANLEQWSDIVQAGTYCVVADRANDRDPGTTLVVRSFVGDPAPLGRPGVNTGNTCDDELWEGSCSEVGAPDTTWFVMSCVPATLEASTCATDPQFDGDLQAYALDETEQACTYSCAAQIRLTEPGAAWLVAEAFDTPSCGPFAVEINSF